MSLKQIRRLIEKLEDAIENAEFDLEIAVDERNDYEFQLSEKTDELDLMGEELRLLCQLLYDANVPLPKEGHFTDINLYVPRNDPHKGQYKYG
ncbi:MAG: hypothetical protein J6Y48_16830 [Clostridia bacterium]|nr:hypothetical protein [Clostridia bacterium]